MRAGFWQSSGGHTSVSHSTRPPWHAHWVQVSMCHVSPSTKYSPPGAWQMEGVLSSGFCTSKSSGEREDPNTGNEPAPVSPACEEPGAVGFEGQRRRAGGSYPEDREENIPCTETQGRRTIFQEMVRVCQHGMTEYVETIKL